VALKYSRLGVEVVPREGVETLPARYLMMLNWSGKTFFEAVSDFYFVASPNLLVRRDCMYEPLGTAIPSKTKTFQGWFVHCLFHPWTNL